MSQVIMENIKKEFGKTLALDNFSVTIPEGSLVSLLGPSGCGKTTALRILAGLLKADQGRTFFDSLDVSDKPAAQRNIGMVFQAYSLFPNMSARANVEFGLRTRKTAEVQIKKLVDDIFEIIGLTEHQSKYPFQLSGGQQQRVALARAIVIRPKVLLLDEPLSALDAQVRTQLRDEIRRVQLEFGITTLFVTHDQEEAMTISDQVGVMHKGQLMQIDKPQLVYENPANPIVARFVGAMNEIPAIVGGNKVTVFGKTFDLSPRSELSILDSEANSYLALVRPEALTISTDSMLGDRARILRTSFMGATSLIHVGLDSAREISVLLSAQSALGYSIGQEVYVQANVSEVLVTSK
jgi:putative spermidine/putrescine transport system ATP-binding protein